MDYATLWIVGTIAALVLGILWIIMPIAVFFIHGEVVTLRRQSDDVKRLLRGTDSAPGVIPQLQQLNQHLAAIRAQLESRQSTPPNP